jgi:hypothetical protein
MHEPHRICAGAFPTAVGAHVRYGRDAHDRKVILCPEVVGTCNKGIQMKSFNTPSLLLAGLLALAGAANAQTAAGTSNVPNKAGEASTMTNGVPNAMTTNTPGSETPAMTKGQIRQDAKGRDAASATTNSPGRAGEASTMVQGRPNANPNAPTLTKSKSERRMEREMKRAQRKQEREMAAMGHRGAEPATAAGISPNSSAGNPSVFKGGTPK